MVSQSVSYIIKGWLEKLQNTKCRTKATCRRVRWAMIQPHLPGFSLSTVEMRSHEISIPVGSKIRCFPTIGELGRLRNPRHPTTKQDRAMSHEDPMLKRLYKKLPSRLLNHYGVCTKLKITLFVTDFQTLWMGLSVFAVIKRHAK